MRRGKLQGVVDWGEFKALNFFQFRFEVFIKYASTASPGIFWDGVKDRHRLQNL